MERCVVFGFRRHLSFRFLRFEKITFFLFSERFIVFGPLLTGVWFVFDRLCFYVFDCIFMCLIVLFRSKRTSRASCCSKIGRVRLPSNPNLTGLANSPAQKEYLGSTAAGANALAARESHPPVCNAARSAWRERYFICHALDFAMVTAQVNRYFDLFFSLKKRGKRGSKAMFNDSRGGVPVCLTGSGGRMD